MLDGSTDTFRYKYDSKPVKQSNGGFRISEPCTVFSKNGYNFNILFSYCELAMVILGF